MRILALILLVLIVGNKTRAATINAASTSRADVQTALNTAASGDTVVIPSGSSTWATQVTNYNKGLTIKGAGVGSTIITDGLNNDALFELFVNAEALDISGIEWDGNAATSSGIQDAIIRLVANADNSNIRLHHMRFTDYDKRAIVPDASENRMYGLIDNCTFETGNNPQTITFVGQGGNTTWWWDNFDSSFGTADFWFVEDCGVYYSGTSTDAFIDALGGLKFVIRYNSLTNIRFSIHGTDSGNYQSPVLWEFYENDHYNHPGAGVEGKAWQSRGGSGVVYSNTWEDGYTAQLELNSYRSDPDNGLSPFGNWGDGDGSQTHDGNSAETSGSHDGGDNQSILTDSGASWGTGEWTTNYQWYIRNTTDGSGGFITTNDSTTITVTLAGGTDNDFDDGDTYEITDGYPLLGQIGRTPNGGGTDSRNGGKNYQLLTVHEWGNLHDGSDIDFSVGSSHPRTLSHVIAGREYTNDTVMAGYSAYVYPHPLRGTTPIIITGNTTLRGNVTLK